MANPIPSIRIMKRVFRMCGDIRWCGKDSQPELLKGAFSPLMILVTEYLFLKESKLKRN